MAAADNSNCDLAAVCNNNFLDHRKKITTIILPQKSYIRKMSQLAESLKIRLVIGWFRLTKKLKPTGELLALRRDGSGVRSALIIVPRGRQNSRIARYFLKSLKPDGEVDLYVLMDNSVYHSMRERLPARVETYSAHDVGWFLLPKKDLIHRIVSKKYHAVVDMHPFFNLPTAYLTYLSGAPLRVGFSSKFSENFFNIEMERKDNHFIEESYLSIQRLLDL